MEVVSKFIGRKYTMLKQFISKRAPPQLSTPFHPRFATGVAPPSHQENGQVGKDDGDEQNDERRRREDAIEDMENRRGVRDFGDVTKETAEKVSGKAMDGIEPKRLRRQLLMEMKESAREKALRRTHLPH